MSYVCGIFNRCWYGAKIQILLYQTLMNLRENNAILYQTKSFLIVSCFGVVKLKKHVLLNVQQSVFSKVKAIRKRINSVNCLN
jgi:hypothetical protein